MFGPLCLEYYCRGGSIYRLTLSFRCVDTNTIAFYVTVLLHQYDPNAPDLLTKLWGGKAK